MARQPLLSIVVTIVEGGAALSRCLEALRDQRDAPPLEVLVPFDHTVPGMDRVREAFPEYRFVALGEIPTRHPPRSAGGQHELYDRRRAAGLAAAEGTLIAIIEDRGAPRYDWARTAARLHAELPFGVIGGAIEPVRSTLLNWAFWLCDFSRYGLPFPSGAVRWASDVNVSYKRAALERTRALWQDGYQEPTVHWALTASGETLYLSSDLVVDHQMAPLRLGPALAERFDWGRLFGAILARHFPSYRRLLLFLLSPAIPAVLLARHTRVAVRRGEGTRLLRALPLLVLLLTAWIAGEAWGVLTGHR